MTDFTAADATALSQATLASDINFAVAKKSLDNTRQQGEAAIALLDAASQVASQPIHPGKGLGIDVTA